MILMADLVSRAKIIPAAAAVAAPPCAQIQRHEPTAAAKDNKDKEASPLLLSSRCISPRQSE